MMMIIMSIRRKVNFRWRNCLMREFRLMSWERVYVKVMISLKMKKESTKDSNVGDLNYPDSICE